MSNQASAVALREETGLAEVTDQEMALLFERVVIQGDLSQLTPDERNRYYLGYCQRARLDPYERPFGYLMLDKKLVLYAFKNCTDQVRRRDGISTKLIGREVVDGIVIATALAIAPDGRSTEASGAVPIVKEGGKWSRDGDRNVFKADGTFIPVSPADRANAYLKAETKAKRRATLELGGISAIDESELDTIEPARVQRVQVDPISGEVRQPATIREVKPAAPAPGGDAPIDVAGADVQPATTTKRSGIVQPDGRVVDRHTGEITAPPIDSPSTVHVPERVTERTAKAIKAQAAFLHLSDEEVDAVAVAEFNVPDAAAMTELDGLFLAKLLTYARQINGAMVTSRIEKILKDMEADPERDRVIDSVWLSERFKAKEAELEAKVATSASGGR